MQIGPNGRLGNQMFQYAALVGAATMKGYSWAIDRNEQNELWDAFALDKASFLKEEDKKNIQFQYREPNFYFNTSIFAIQDFTDLYGYFQSPLYFQHCFDFIKSEFTFKDNIVLDAKKQLASYKSSAPVCSIHVRRTDYLNSPDYHPACTINYYEKAKSLILNSNSDVTFLVFGDDHDWIRENLLDKRSVLVTRNDGKTDMCLMSLCDAHIIANSSFSWWASILGNHNSTIAPRVWFGPKGPSNWDTVYHENWVRL